MAPPPPPKDILSPAPTRGKSRAKYASRHKQSISQPLKQAVRPRARNTSTPGPQVEQRPVVIDPGRTRSRSRSRTRTAHQQQAQAHARTAARKVSFAPVASLFASLRPRMRLPPLFNLLRNFILFLVLVFSIVCLAIAVHFQGILLTSDLTRFIPFAIFVCALTLLADLVLLGFGLRNGWNPISVRIELGCLGLMGTLWLALGTFLGLSPSQDATVECFSSASDNDPIDFPGFNTDLYHAQYRVLEAFSLFNTVLIWAFLLLLLSLSLREHFLLGRHEIWLRSVTAYSWFGDWKGRPSPSRQSSSRSTARMLPPPVTAKGKDMEEFGGGSGWGLGRGRGRTRERDQSRQRSQSRGRDIYEKREPSTSRRAAPIISMNRHRSQSRDVEKSMPITSRFAGVASKTMGFALRDNGASASTPAASAPKREQSTGRHRSTSRSRGNNDNNASASAPQRPGEAARRGSSQNRSAQRQRSTSRDVERSRSTNVQRERSQSRTRDTSGPSSGNTSGNTTAAAATPGPSRQLSGRLADLDKRLGGKPPGHPTLERRATDFLPRSRSGRGGDDDTPGGPSSGRNGRPGVHRENTTKTTKSAGRTETRSRQRSSSRTRYETGAGTGATRYETAVSTPAPVVAPRRPSQRAATGPTTTGGGGGNGPRTAPGPPKPPAAHTRETRGRQPTTGSGRTPGR